MAKNKGGRPTVMTKEVLAKLDDAFSWSATDEEACFYAGVAVDALYRYIDKFPEYRNRKELLKRQTTFNARRVVSNKVKDGDDKNSQRRLERRAKDEFSLKDTETNINVNIDFSKLSDEELLKMIK